MKIVLLCATNRGLAVLEKLHELAPGHDLAVCSFREEPVEPAFLDGIRRFALGAGAEFFEGRNAAAHEGLWSRPVDLLLAVSWRTMVPRAVHSGVRLGAYVIHDSLLPAYRGFSPTVWSLLNRERETGATLFRMTDEVDAGDIIDQRRVPLDGTEYIGEVLPRVTAAYLELLEANLPALLAGTATGTPQDSRRATFGCRRLLSDNEIAWDKPTEEIHSLIRAVSRPYAGAFTWYRGRRLIVWSARPVQEPRFAGRVPGRIARVIPGTGAVALTGDGALLLTEVQLEGEAPRCGAEVLNVTSGTLRGHADRERE